MIHVPLVGHRTALVNQEMWHKHQSVSDLTRNNYAENTVLLG